MDQLFTIQNAVSYQQQLPVIQNTLRQYQQQLPVIQNTLRQYQQQLSVIQNARQQLPIIQQAIECINQRSYLINQQANILKSIIISKGNLSEINDVDVNFSNNQNLLYNLWSIDWYIPIWIPSVYNLNKNKEFDIGKELNINNPSDIELLKNLDEKLFELLKKDIESEQDFLTIFNDKGLFYLYQQHLYKDVVILSLTKIESILTNFVNYLDNKIIPNLRGYLTSDRTLYKEFSMRDKEDYLIKLEELKSSVDSPFNQKALKCLIFLFSDDSTSQLYSNFNRKKKTQCKLTPIDDIPLCRNLFLHGFGYTDDISQKLAIKALVAYRFFQEFSI